MIKTQKEFADCLIYKIRAIDPYCIVAGGAPRDWHFCKEATDIDIYIYSNHRNVIVEKQLTALGFELERLGVNTEESANTYSNPNITGVFEILNLQFKAQVIVLNISTFKLLDTFCLSICKAWYTPERGVNLTTDFKLTEKSGVIFRTGELYNMPEAYLNKIKKKFPDFKYSLNKNNAIDELLCKV